MPIRTSFTYDSGTYPLCLANSNNLNSSRYGFFDEMKMTAFAGAQGVLQKILPPGTFAGSIPGSTKCRALPRTRVISSTGTVLTVAKFTARFFVPGDQIAFLQPYDRIALALAWANGDVLTLTGAGSTAAYTVSNFSTLTALCAAAADYFNSSVLGADFIFSAAAQNIHIQGRGLARSASLAVAKTVAGTGTALLRGGGASATAQSNVAVGTVQSVDALADTITLTAAESVPTFPGAIVGDPSSSPKDLGCTSLTEPIDLSWGATRDVALYQSATILSARLPFWDDYLRGLFPMIFPE